MIDFLLLQTRECWWADRSPHHVKETFRRTEEGDVLAKALYGWTPSKSCPGAWDVRLRTRMPTEFQTHSWLLECSVFKYSRKRWSYSVRLCSFASVRFNPSPPPNIFRGIFFGISPVPLQFIAGAVEQRVFDTVLAKNPGLSSLGSTAVRSANLYLGSLTIVDWLRFVGLQH